MEIDRVYQDLHRLSQGLEGEALKAEVNRKGSPLRLAAARLRRYRKSEAAAESFGFIGVGRISFADARLREFNRRLARKGM
jgi:hypothetical protein